MNVMAAMLCAICIFLTSSVSGGNLVSPDSRFSVRTILSNNNSQDLAIFDQITGSRALTLLSGVSKVAMCGVWSPCSKRLIIRASYGTRMTLFELIEIDVDGFQVHTIVDRAGKADFEKSEILPLGWKNDDCWFLLISAGSLSHFRIDPDEMMDSDHNVFARLQKVEFAPEEEMIELTNKRIRNFHACKAVKKYRPRRMSFAP